MYYMFDVWKTLYWIVCLGSSAHDLANSAEAISSLCLGRVSPRFDISLLACASVVQVCDELL